MTDLVTTIRKRYLAVLDRIGVAARAAGRDPSSVRLVVVTKSQPIELVQAVVEAGVKILGENYPEEGVMKIQSVPVQSDVEWHMIGHVQSRKAKLVAGHFNLIHSMDGSKLAGRLDRLAAGLAVRLPVLLEFNVGGEDSKFGWPAQDEAGWPGLIPELSTVLNLEHLEVRGLMAMPPFSDAPETARPYFQKLRRLKEFLSRNFSETNLSELSMGTSADYEVAVQEGATLVRVGTAIVGPRPN
jgi:pyridoxal phosphate enzyme (YggS family)